MFSPAGIIIYKGAFYPHRGTEEVLMTSLCAYAQDDDMHSPRVPDYEEGGIPTSIRKRCRLHLSSEFIYFSHG
jgi:hypothetical protein